jgi:hypothetical protein
LYCLKIEELNEPAEVDEDSLEDEYGSCTAEDGERLTGQQAEETAGQSMAQEGLKHTLHHSFLVGENFSLCARSLDALAKLSRLRFS